MRPNNHAVAALIRITSFTLAHSFAGDAHELLYKFGSGTFIDKSS